MDPTARKNVRRGAGLSTDAALGLAGCSLAAASATFGIVMTMHGPVASFGKSQDFTVFAQLAPRAQAPGGLGTERLGTDKSEDLDLTATASIPKRSTPASERAAASSVALQDVSTDAATIMIDGRSSVVRVGDMIPGVGQVLAIVPGTAPMLRTTGGVIAMTR